MSSARGPSVRKVVRMFLGSATLGFAMVGFAIRDDPRWFVASGLLGIMWTAWDYLVEHVFDPFLNWVANAWGGNLGMLRGGELRPTLAETIRLLESHLASGASRSVQVQAAIRLEEIYRTIKKDPVQADRIVALVRERFPDAVPLLRTGADSQRRAGEST